MSSTELKKGFTTGTCAQAATKGACIMLANRKLVDEVDVETPSGAKLRIGLLRPELGDDFARCAVVKDAGDDPDVTDGAIVCAEVRLTDKSEIEIKGGEGVGKATKPGLAVRVGEWAINPTPKKMIIAEASKFLSKGKGLEVTISVPGGEELARKTYNPRLGIVGGISIIGTTGIVEPKSLDAYKASLSLELDVMSAEGYNRAVFVLGYVGMKFCQEALGIKEDSIIKTGDHVGFMLEEAAKRKFKEALLVGHIGKLIKVANGQFNTHSKFGDNRVDSIARYAASCGANEEILKSILKETTAEATINVLRENGLTKAFERIAADVSERASELTGGKMKIDCIILSLEGEVLAKTIS